MGKFSHVDGSGKARMVNVGGKPLSRRMARASGRILMAQETVELVRKNEIAKGDVLAVARIAGIQAAKKTAELIPLCHPLPLDQVEVELELVPGGVEARAAARCTGRTGVEMEALTAVAAALLSVYDMCKAVDKKMRITDILLVEKTKEPVE